MHSNEKKKNKNYIATTSKTKREIKNKNMNVCT